MKVGDKVRLVKALGDLGEPDYIASGANGEVVSVGKYGPFPVGVEFGPIHWFCDLDELEVDSSTEV